MKMLYENERVKWKWKLYEKWTQFKIYLAFAWQIVSASPVLIKVFHFLEQMNLRRTIVKQDVKQTIIEV